MAQRKMRGTLLDIDASSDADLELGDRYVYRDRERVRAYLIEHPELIGILREADPEIARRFGEQTTVVMDIIDDPDIVDEQMLFGFIRTSLAPQDAVDLLHRLDREWWIARGADVRDQLALSIEMV